MVHQPKHEMLGETSVAGPSHLEDGEDLDTFFAELKELSGRNHEGHGAGGMLDMSTLAADCAPLLNEKESNAFSEFLENVLVDPNYLFEPKLVDGLPGYSQLAVPSSSSTQHTNPSNSQSRSPSHSHSKANLMLYDMPGATHSEQHQHQLQNPPRVQHQQPLNNHNLAVPGSLEFPSQSNHALSPPSASSSSNVSGRLAPRLYTSSFDEQTTANSNQRDILADVKTHHLLPETQYFLETEKRNQLQRQGRTERPAPNMSYAAIYKEISAITVLPQSDDETAPDYIKSESDKVPPILSRVNGLTMTVRPEADNVSATGPVRKGSQSKAARPSLSASKRSESLNSSSAVTSPMVDSPGAGNSLKRKASVSASEDGSVTHRRKKDSLSDDQKRFNHLSSEQKRRDTIKRYLDELCSLIPKGGDGSAEASRPKRGNGKGKSKKIILKHVYEHMVQIAARNQAMRAMFLANGVSTNGIPDSSNNQ